MDDKTAIIYPIILPQRLELLVGTSTGLFQYVVPVDALAFNTQVQKMARNLRNKVPANMPKLYHWLVSPAEEMLKNKELTPWFLCQMVRCVYCLWRLFLMANTI